jgi:RNA-directed DNA polymerase
MGGLLPDGGRLRCGEYRHPNKPKRWIVGRYFGTFNKFRNDRWVFGDRDSGGHLVKFAWTSINRHVMVKGVPRRW